ncbi:MAG: hypothetical protein ACKVZJ_15915 [Phycisphaerales bacterium]
MPHADPAPHKRPVRYTVTAEIDDPRVAERYITWLLGDGTTPGHAAAVLAWSGTSGGGARAEVCLLDTDGDGNPAASTVTRVECRYEFASRAELDRYLREGAPALREEGRRLFLDAGGVRLSRRIGEVLGRAVTAAS